MSQENLELARRDYAAFQAGDFDEWVTGDEALHANTASADAQAPMGSRNALASQP